MEHWNLERTEDVLRIAADATGAKFEELLSAQLLWIDRLGMYLYIQVCRWTRWFVCHGTAAAAAAMTCMALCGVSHCACISLCSTASRAWGRRAGGPIGTDVHAFLRPCRSSAAGARCTGRPSCGKCHTNGTHGRC